MPKHKHHHPPGPHPFDREEEYYHLPPPPPHHHHRHWGLPLPDDFAESLLREIMETPEQARATRRILESSPPEIAIVAYLILRLYEEMRQEMMAIHERLDYLEKSLSPKTIDKGGG